MYMKTTRSATLGRQPWRRRGRRELLRRGGGGGRLGAAAVPAEQVAPELQHDQQEDRRDGYHDLKHGWSLDPDLLQPFCDSFLFFPLQDRERCLKNPTQETISTDTNPER